jgi:protein ImuA
LRPGPLAAAGGGGSAASALEELHPALWRAHQAGRGRDAGYSSGYAALDAELPGGGWPCRALTELLLPHPGVGEMRLVAPALAALQGRQRSVMLFDPPAALCPPAWQALGIDLRQLVIVQGRMVPRETPAVADTLWALEQALRCGHVGAALAWLPARLRIEALRRLQLAAQGHDGPAFLLRDAAARLEPSPAALRLLLVPCGAGELQLTLLKRRGPPPAGPLQLALEPLLARRARGPSVAAQGAPAPESAPRIDPAVDSAHGGQAGPARPR